MPEDCFGSGLDPDSIGSVAPDSESGATIKILLCFKSLFRQSNFVDNTDDISNGGFSGFPANESLGSRVSDPDSLRSLDPVSVFGIRIREGKDDQLCRNFMFLSPGCSLLKAEGFFCNLNALYAGQGIGK